MLIRLITDTGFEYLVPKHQLHLGYHAPTGQVWREDAKGRHMYHLDHTWGAIQKAIIDAGPDARILYPERLSSKEDET